MIKQKILEDLKKVIDDLGYQTPDTLLYIPKNIKFGMYSTNIALQLAKLNSKNNKQSLKEIANQIISGLKKHPSTKKYLERVETVEGFINFFIKPKSLMDSLHQVCNYNYFVDPKFEIDGIQKKKIMVEFTDPNPFKEFHIGHLYSNALGESLSRLLEATGAEVKRVNYFGDVGMHVAKSLWGLEVLLKEEGLTIKDLEKQPLRERIKFLGRSYAKGAKSYDEEEWAREQMKKVNLFVYIVAQQMQSSLGFQPQVDYQKHIKVDKKELDRVKMLFEKGRKWSLEYFESIFSILGTKFDSYYPESIVAEYGTKIVREYVEKGVFMESDGAIIFPGEKFDLHRRVFINSLNLPTYEAKELGLAFKKYQDFEYDQSIVVTGNEIKEYFQVLMAALGQTYPKLSKKTYHIPHGMVRMIEGKISSRKGNVVTFEWLYDQVRDKVAAIMKNSSISAEEKEQTIKIITIGAIKLALLKHNPQADIIFDLKKSVSLQGDSGPYLQYTYARAKSVLRNASYDYQLTQVTTRIEEEEKELLIKIEHFHSIVEEAAQTLHPNLVVSYLLDFAKVFNLFYQKHPIIKAEKEKMEFRLALTCAVAVVLKQGLYLLGIEAPEQM